MKTNLVAHNTELAAQLRYLNEMLAEIGDSVGATDADLSRLRDMEEALRQASRECAQAREQVALAKAQWDAAETVLAQTVDGRAQTEVQTRAEVSVLLQSLSKRPAVRRECLRSLQAIFAEPVPGAALSPTPVPVPAKNGFWNKLFIVERADGGDYGLFALAPAAEAQSEQTAPPAFGRRESAHGQRRNPQLEPRTMRICEPLDLLVL